MKKLILLISCFSLLCFAKCRKDKMPNAVLPPVTQVGKNTIGFAINDAVWVPYYKCGFGRNPCGEAHVEYGPPSTPQGTLDFGFTREEGSKRSDLSISSALIGTITTEGDKTDSIAVEYSDNSLSADGYFVGPLSGSKFTITKIDPQNQIISGQFELVLKERKNNGIVTNNSIILKNGRFDFKFNVCKCSN